MKRLVRSFKFAFEGFAQGIKTETNWKIGLVEAVGAVLAGIYFHLTRGEWMVVIIMISLVLASELFNSAIETIVDSFTPDSHPGAKIAKDFAAGAVVLVIIASAIVGVIVFLPHIKIWLIRSGI